MAGKTFTATIKAWGDKALENAELVLKASAQEVMEIAQEPVAQGGRMPVVSSTLRNSLVSSLDGAEVAEGPDSYTLTITGMKLGGSALFAWTADYARARHYKPEDFGQGGGMWRDAAAAQWQRIVAENAAKVVK